MKTLQEINLGKDTITIPTSFIERIFERFVKDLEKLYDYDAKAKADKSEENKHWAYFYRNACLYTRSDILTLGLEPVWIIWCDEHDVDIYTWLGEEKPPKGSYFNRKYYGHD